MIVFLDYTLRKVGMVLADGKHPRGQEWNSYRQTEKKPTGYQYNLSSFENACNAQTENLSVISYSNGSFYGWLAARFVSEYEGDDYDVYKCVLQAGKCYPYISKQ